MTHKGTLIPMQLTINFHSIIMYWSITTNNEPTVNPPQLTHTNKEHSLLLIHPPRHLLNNTNTKLMELLRAEQPLHHTPFYPQFRYKDNTKSSKIQIFPHYFCIFFINQ